MIMILPLKLTLLTTKPNLTWGNCLISNGDAKDVQLDRIIYSAKVRLYSAKVRFIFAYTSRDATGACR
jgi:hypothetical protein